MAVREPVGERPERLAQGPLHPVALDRAADLAARRDAEPDVGVVLVAAGEAVEDQVAVRVRGRPRGRRGRTRRCATGADACAPRRRPPPSLRRQALPALAAPALEDRPAAAGAHPRAEPVGPGPLALLRLVGPLHRSARSIRTRLAGAGRGNLFFGICGAPIAVASQGRRYGRDGVGGDVAGAAPAACGPVRNQQWTTLRPDRRSAARRGPMTWTRSGRTSAPGCGPRSPIHLQALAGAAAARRRSAATTLHLSAPDGIRAWVERRYGGLIRGRSSPRSAMTLADIAFGRGCARGRRPGRARRRAQPRTTPSSAS